MKRDPDSTHPIPRPDPNQPPAAQPTEILLAMLLWGEARGEGLIGLRAVAQVVANRARRGGWFGRGWREVMLKPYQFSCFLPDDPQAAWLLTPLAHSTPETWQKCLYVAREALEQRLPNMVGNATHYYAVSIPAPRWAKEMTFVRQIGRHRFYE